jgi:hypothetical protein
VASKVAVKAPVWAVMAEFCQTPPTVAVTQAWANMDKPDIKSTMKTLMIRFSGFMIVTRD